MTRRTLIVVAKQPAPGQTKTRLSPPLDAREASALYECFLLDTLETVREARRMIEFQPMIAYLPEGAEGYFHTLAPDFDLFIQAGNDLSERLHNATSHCLIHGYDEVVIMDSDSPTLPAINLRDAFMTLDGQTDIVLGPCDDGGYYLIGLKRPAPDLFLNVTMSTPMVIQETLVQAERNQLHVEMLPTSYDIDYVQDIKRLVAELEQASSNIAVHTRGFLEAHPVLSKAGEL